MGYKDERFIERFSEHSRLIVPATEAFRALMSNDGLAEQHAVEISRLENAADQVTRETVLAIHRTGENSESGRPLRSTYSFARLGRALVEVPVGFRWFVDGLKSGALGFAGEESAGAAFLRRDGSVWTTDKDGLILGLLAAEMTARTGQDPGVAYAGLTREFGASFYERTDAPATAAQKSLLSALSPEQIGMSSLAGDPVRATLTKAPGNAAPIGGVKVVGDHGWFAARPSGTEDIYKIYAESFRSEAHLQQIEVQAEAAVNLMLQHGVISECRT